MTTTSRDIARTEHDSSTRSRLAVAVLATGENDQAPFVPQRLHATTVDVLTPHGTALGDAARTDTIAFTDAHVEDYALLIIPRSATGPQLQDNLDAIEFVHGFARSATTPGAETAGPHVMIDVGVNAGGRTTVWQEVGPDIRDVTGINPRDMTADGPGLELPGYLVRICTRIFEMTLLTAHHIP